MERMWNWMFLPKLTVFTDAALLFIRLLTGTFLIHGVWDNVIEPKRMAEFVGFLAANGFAAPALMAPLSVYAQLAIGVALCLGVLTRWAGLLLAFNFTVGVIMVHLAQSYREIWPAAVLVAIGLLVAATGAGRISIDALAERRSG
jgi:putative oxidoreductase